MVLCVLAHIYTDSFFALQKKHLKKHIIRKNEKRRPIFCITIYFTYHIVFKP